MLKALETPRDSQNWKGKSSVRSSIDFSLFRFHFRESLGSVFQEQSPQKPQTSQDFVASSTSDIPSKRFKEDVEHTQDLALNFAARFITARAQWLQHQMLQQHQKNISDEQSKLSLQMLQIAQFQAYLALLNKTPNKTENSDSIEENKS